MSAMTWKESDDAQLREGVEVVGPKRWHAIKETMFGHNGRSVADCRARWGELTRSTNLQLWTRVEDALLTDLVDEYNGHNWALIASQVPGRNAKQCRERWQNHLRPDLCHALWTADEDAAIVQWQKQLGNRWALIALELPGRTDNMIKNRWYGSLVRTNEAATPRRQNHETDDTPTRRAKKPRTRNAVDEDSTDTLVRRAAHVLAERQRQQHVTAERDRP